MKFGQIIYLLGILAILLFGVFQSTGERKKAIKKQDSINISTNNTAALNAIFDSNIAAYKAVYCSGWRTGANTVIDMQNNDILSDEIVVQEYRKDSVAYSNKVDSIVEANRHRND